MKTPTDTELLDYLDELDTKAGWGWELQHEFGCVFLSKCISSGTQTVREAIIQHMDKAKNLTLPPDSAS